MAGAKLETVTILRASVLVAALALASAPPAAWAQPTDSPEETTDEAPEDAAEKKSASGLDVSGWPAQAQEGHAHFEKQCGTCHLLSLALEKRHAPRTWRRHIVRMMKKENSTLDAATGRSIYHFLTFYDRKRTPPPKPAD